MHSIRWVLLEFGGLEGEELYDLLALRQAVFVVEQKCAYLDADGLDRQAHHLLGRDVDGRLIAYCRIIPPGVKHPQPVIGRVVVDPVGRGGGLGIALMEEGIRCCRGLYPGMAIRISAQQYLQGFYERLGFACLGSGNPYDEDGIPHVEMLLTGNTPSAPRTS